MFSATARRRNTVVATASALAAAIVLGAVTMGAGTATAAVTNFSILSSPGGSFGTSCSYELTALTSTDEADVYFYDDGALIGSGGVTPRDGVATIDWTPQTPGTHILNAFQSGVPGLPLPVQVTQRLNLGSVCFGL